MSESIADHHKAENEVIFRQFNEQALKGMDVLKQVAKEENQESYLPDMEDALQFYCECADEKCRQRIVLSPSLYTALHKQHDYFVIIPGHEVPEIERVVRSEAHYFVVEKYMEPPFKTGKLHKTELNNT